MNEEEQAFLDDLAGTQEPEVTEPENAEPEEPNPESNPEENPEGGKPEDKKYQNRFEKSNAKFAEMRVQNKTYSTAFNQLATALQLDTNKPQDELVKDINNMVLELQAKQSNIPIEVMARLKELEDRDTAYQQEKLKSKAASELIGLQSKYGLSDEQMDDFCKGILDDGINPYEQEVNLEFEFYKRNFDDIVNARIDAAVKQEQQRAATATSKSATPVDTNGKGTNTDKPKIENMSQLDDFFRNIGN